MITIIHIFYELSLYILNFNWVEWFFSESKLEIEKSFKKSSSLRYITFSNIFEKVQSKDTSL